MSDRPSRDEFWFSVAAQYATRATCPRASIGAVLVKFDRIIGAGFNGAPEGEPHCLDVGCELVSNHCVRTRHAEVNALRNALLPPFGATLYVAGPRLVCPSCGDQLYGQGVTDIRYRASDSSLSGVIADVTAWQHETFPHATPASVAEHLRREAVELADDPTNRHELADVVTLAIGLADQLGVDLVEIIREKLEINKRRVWGQPDALGVVEHIR